MNKPSVIIKQPQSGNGLQQERAEDEREEREAQARIARRQKSDALQVLMNNHPYIGDCLIPGMTINGKRVWVSRYYDRVPVKDSDAIQYIAIDLFDTPHQQDEADPEQRRQLLKARGIKYAWLGHEPGHLRMQDIFEQLAEQA